MDAVPAANKERLVAQGEALYQQRLKSQLDPTYHGQIVAIEVESGDYFIGNRAALTNASGDALHITQAL